MSEKTRTPPYGKYVITFDTFANGEVDTNTVKVLLDGKMLGFVTALKLDLDVNERVSNLDLTRYAPIED